MEKSDGCSKEKQIRVKSSSAQLESQGVKVTLFRMYHCSANSGKISLDL